LEWASRIRTKHPFHHFVTPPLNDELWVPADSLRGEGI